MLTVLENTREDPLVFEKIKMCQISSGDAHEYTGNMLNVDLENRHVHEDPWETTDICAYDYDNRCPQNNEGQINSKKVKYVLHLTQQ